MKFNYKIQLLYLYTAQTVLAIIGQIYNERNERSIY